jgi:pimeloyl-ACP methyl ester carboxylesterase
MVHGDREAGSMVHPDDLIAFEERLPNVTVAHIPGAGHAIHREQSDAFEQAMREFLDGLPERPTQG